jgi:hypothetical protein
MGWVTLDDGQHVYIGSRGELMPRGPGSARTGTASVRARAGEVLRAKAAREQRKSFKPGPLGAKPAALEGRTQLADRSHQVANTGIRSRAAAAIRGARAVQRAHESPETHAQPGDVVNMRVGKIAFDPERFQYKLSTTGEHGVTSQLHGVKQWNPESAGVLSVWKDPANAQTYVVNGHHRLDLANKLGVDKVTVRFLDAPDAATARMKGAVVNIAEGRGTPLDAAKFFREAGGKALIDKHGIPMTEHTAKHGLNLAGLEEGLFKKVINQEIPMERASIIGGSGLSDEHQISVHNMALKGRANNETVKELVANAKSSPTLSVKGRNLFGDTHEEESLALHRAKVSATVSKSLAADKSLFGYVSKSKHAAALEERGRSHIDVAETGKVSSEAAQVLGVFHELKNRGGPIARELNQAAERLHAGEHEATVYKEARQAISGHVKSMLSGGAAAFAA